MSKNAGYRRALLIVLWLVMMVATWGVGLAFRPSPGEGAGSFYLTLFMLTVAELLSCLYFAWMGGGSVKRRNMPLQMGGGVMVFLYIAGVVVLTAMAAFGVEFKWLLLGHVAALLLLIVGWSIVSLASRHASSQDKKDRKMLAPFSAIRERYGEFCHRLESAAECFDSDVLREALRIRDEVILYARTDSILGMERIDQEVEVAMTALENAENGNGKIVDSLKKLQLAVEHRERRLANAS